MKKHVRGKILAGQIISLAGFLYLAIGFFVLTFTLRYHGYLTYAILAMWLAIFSLAESIIAAIGITHAILPFAKYRKGTAIVSIIFDGLMGILLFISLFRNFGVSTNQGFVAVFMCGLFAALGLLISGMIQAQKEGIHLPHYSKSHSSLNPTTNRFDEDYVPLAVPPQTRSPEPSQAKGYSPEASKTTSDLQALKSLYDARLITEEEYSQKKKEILNRDFDSK